MIPLLSSTVLLLALFADSQISFKKVFPASDPPYVGITVTESGAGEYRSDPKDEQPVLFQLSPAEREQLFALAAKVDLKQNLESPAKVANMGMKTIRVERDGKAAEAKWNYTDNADARALGDFFERISESEQRFLELERTAKYEKIGVNEALLNLQADWERKQLVAVSQYLPLLDRITRGESYLSMARKRAAALAETFRLEQDAKPAASPDPSK
jgi:hypothetical protein